MSRITSPSLETLSAFALGDLLESELGAVAEHLSASTVREEQVTRLDGMADAVISESRRLPNSGLHSDGRVTVLAGSAEPARPRRLRRSSPGASSGLCGSSAEAGWGWNARPHPLRDYTIQGRARPAPHSSAHPEPRCPAALTRVPPGTAGSGRQICWSLHTRRPITRLPGSTFPSRPPNGKLSSGGREIQDIKMRHAINPC
jgi:anti-sigma factor RsiW